MPHVAIVTHGVTKLWAAPNSASVRRQLIATGPLCSHYNLGSRNVQNFNLIRELKSRNLTVKELKGSGLSGSLLGQSRHGSLGQGH